MASAGSEVINTARVNTDTARIDKLKELYRSVPMQLDFERIRIMKETYDDTAGFQQIIRRAKFLATLLDRKKIYIDDNLFVGSLAGSLNAIYTHPEWNVEWMKEENTVGNSETEEDREANAWALDYWDKRCLKTRSEEIFQKRYGFDPTPAIQSMLICSFHEWPGGGGNLNYPLVYQEGLASVIKGVK
jgi:formate C-acetyltransferase